MNGIDYQIFELGDFALECGVVLPDAKIAYTTRGALNESGDNAILLPSAYLGDHHGYDFLVGAGKALDPENTFIVATNMFQNGLSSSPSNTPPPFHGPDFPAIETRDNVNGAFRLLSEGLGVKGLHAVIGFSMGAQQAFQWAASYPDFVANVVGYCGSAKEYPHGRVRLEGFKQAVMADSSYNNGHYTAPPTAGLKAGGTHWAAWGTSQEWFRKERYKELGLDSTDAVVAFYQQRVLSWDANNLIGMAGTWQRNNIGNTPGFDGDHEAALRSIKARVLYMPCETDMYFHIAALRYEAQFIPDVHFKPIASLWGHLAGGGFAAEDAVFIDNAIRDFLG